MCVAIYKPASIPTPDLKTLKACWEANPDGAGFAMYKNGSIEIHKGFMNWKAFEKAFKKYGLSTFSGPLLLHFRIATHGNICKGNTHPFLISNSKSVLQNTNLTCLESECLIHNGVLPITPSDKTISDSMELCKRLSRFDSTSKALDLLDEFLGSNKIAIMEHSGTVRLFGDWIDVGGVWFSNLIWQYFDETNKLHQSIKYEELFNPCGEVCPYCESKNVFKDNTYNDFYCEDCGSAWPESM